MNAADSGARAAPITVTGVPVARSQIWIPGPIASVANVDPSGLTARTSDSPTSIGASRCVPEGRSHRAAWDPNSPVLTAISVRPSGLNSSCRILSPVPSRVRVCCRAAASHSPIVLSARLAAISSPPGLSRPGCVYGQS